MRFLRGFELLIMRQHGSELSDLHLQGMFEMQVVGKICWAHYSFSTAESG